MDPFQLLPLAAGALLYALRVRGLRRRGTPVPAWKPIVFAVGVVLVALALVPPLETWAEESFAFHMVQHLLLADLGALCIVAGLTGPVLRPLLSVRAVRGLRVLLHPFVSLPIWAVNLYIWHLPFLYEAALRHDVVHALEHVAFFAAGALMWATVLEILPAPEWFGTAAKMGYVVAVRLISGVLANVLVWSSEPFYDFYEQAERPFGLSAEADQGIAGAVLLVEGSLVTIGALAWLFLRLAAEGELRQELLERGLDPRAVRRAVRYGRAADMTNGNAT